MPLNREPWPDAMARAIDHPAVLPEVRDGLRRARDDAAQDDAAQNDSLDIEAPRAGRLADLYAEAINILNRWEEARSIRATEPFRADILINDYRPVRPYAIDLGAWIQAAEEHERRTAGRAELGITEPDRN
jgi:hypothetical protein